MAYAKMASHAASHPAACPWPQEIDSGMSNEFSSLIRRNKENIQILRYWFHYGIHGKIPMGVALVG